MRQNFVAQFIQPLQRWFCDVWPGLVSEKNQALSVDQCQLQVLQFSTHFINLLHILTDVMVLMDSENCSGSDRQQTTKRWPWFFFFFFFFVQVWLWKVLWSFLVQPLSWLSYKIHFSLHITIQLRNGLLLLWRIREDDSPKGWLFWFAVCSQYTHLLSFFTFAICFKYQTIIERSMLNSWATSPVVVRESTLMILFVGRCQLPMASHCTPHLQGSSLLCKTSWTTTALYVH